jgi:hypothetical protein
VSNEPALSVTAPSLDRTFNEIQGRFATIVHSTNSANRALCKEGFRLVTDARHSTARIVAALDRVRMLVESGALIQRPGLTESLAEELHELGPTILTVLTEARGEKVGA